MKKVTHLTSVHNPLDVRIFKECKELSESGYHVTIIAPCDKDTFVEGINIKAVEPPRNRFQRFSKTNGAIYRLALSEHADIYHFHDPELMIVGLLLKCHGLRVVYDVHEDVPKQILHKAWIRFRVIRKILSWVISVIEKVTAGIFDAVVTVTPDLAARFPKSKTILLRNYVSLKNMDAVVAESIPRDRPVIIYQGTLSPERSIKEIIKAVGLLDGQAELWLFGIWYDQNLLKECASLKGWRYTRDFGNKKITEIFSYVKLADIGLHIAYKLPYNTGGFSTKAFEFMACSIPFISTDNPRNRESYQDCSLYVDPMNANDIAEKMARLVNDMHLRQEMGIRGRRLAETRYSWEKESENLKKLYEQLLI